MHAWPEACMALKRAKIGHLIEGLGFCMAEFENSCMWDSSIQACAPREEISKLYHIIQLINSDKLSSHMKLSD